MEGMGHKRKRPRAEFWLCWARFIRDARLAGLLMIFAAGGFFSFVAAPCAAEKSISLQFGKSLEIGRQGSIFGTIASVCEDRDRNICVLDRGQFTVFVFSPEGKLIRKFGAKGQGPGDFQSPSQIAIAPQGELAVMEDLNSISFFKLDGTFIRRLDLIGLLGPTSIGPDRFLGWTWTPDGRLQVLVDSANKRLAEFGSQPRSLFSTSLADKTGRAVMFNYSSPDYVPELISAANGDTAIVGVGNAYRLTILDSNGRRTGSVARDIEAAKISPRERAFLETQIRDFAKERNWPPAATKEISKKIPDTKPFIQAVRLSPEDIWVFRVGEDITRPKAGLPVDLFSLRGEYRGPSRLRAVPLFISASRMYFLEIEDSGDEYLRAVDYSLSFRNSPR
jgi:hypothetical protein